MATTNEPLGVDKTDPSLLVDDLLTQLSERRSADAGTEWSVRVAELAFDRESNPSEISSNLADASRAVLSAFLSLGEAVRANVRDPSHSANDTLVSLEDLRLTLLPKANLSVDNVALCRSVVTFGVYDEMDPETFIAGRSLQTIVYSEIRNFESQVTEDRQYRTELGTRLELLSKDGRSVWTHEEPQIVDVCRQRRRDFFIAQRITLPPTLPADEYVLKVSVEDKLSNKMNEVAHDLVLRPSSPVARGG